MRPRQAWLGFTLAFAVVLAVMARGTSALLDLEQEQAETEQRALLEEQVRLALWRMDTAMTPLLSQEMAAGLDHPLPHGVKARFSIDANGALRVRGELEPTKHDALRWSLDGVREGSSSSSVTLGSLHEVDEIEQRAIEVDRGTKASAYQQSQSLRNVNELSKRVGKLADNLEAYQSTIDLSRQAPAEEGPGSDGTAPAGPMRVSWVDDELVLVRAFDDGFGMRHAGSVLSWPTVHALLQDEVADLLPSATLLPASPDDEADGRRLATLPLRLSPGELPSAALPAWSPLRATVAIGWAFLLLAGLTVALLLRAALALSERRAAFVSTVTHELRTPLTTFRMYTEMLQDGMVESKRDRYLATLRREAERLGSLVENVLSYARIESDRAPQALETLSVGDLIGRMQERLETRCAEAQLELAIELPPTLETARVHVDASAVEQIVFNLIDNAAKYAPSTDDAIVSLAVNQVGTRVELHVRDRGPGVPPRERRRIFEPFAKSSRHAAGTQPGVGLGLALCRRLARSLGGELELREPSDGQQGSDFVLTLPLAR